MQMQDQIIVAVFPSRRILAKALDHLLDEVTVEVMQAAVVVKSKTGRVLVLNDDLSGDEGGLLGGATGAVVGAIGTTVLGIVMGWQWLVVLALGAVLGGVVGWLIGQLIARTVNLSFARPYANTIADGLQSGHTALMLHVDDAAELLPKLKDEFKPYRAEIVERLRELQANLPSR